MAKAEKANIEAVKCAQIAQQVAEKKEECISERSKNEKEWKGPPPEITWNQAPSEAQGLLVWSLALTISQ